MILTKSLYLFYTDRWKFFSVITILRVNFIQIFVSQLSEIYAEEPYLISLLKFHVNFYHT